MKQILITGYVVILLCFLTSINSTAQVKTRIYDNGIPSSLLPVKSAIVNELAIKAPLELDNLLQVQKGEIDKSIEYDNRFALPQAVNINFLTSAKLSEDKNSLLYSLTIKAEKALNISAQFKEFNLSPNAIISIYTENELTDSITAKENNENKIWATRVYQGNTLNMVLKIPKTETGLSNFTISQISFGYKKYGGDYFGTPGASAPCNINVLCPQGNGWENERNAVVFLLVADGAATCTGSMIMNTCNTNTPYLLTANHCLVGNLNNWVFQYQYWSTTCTPNTGGREDIQFNGCTLKANNATTDFALVQMNQTPPANSGIMYAGWNRSTTPATSSTAIHHPMSDLMKISLSNQAVVSTPWLSGASNHWRVSFNQGIVQHGSSGSALFDQNHRVVGQLHGNQNNICSPGQNTCWCTTQIPSIGEYGRFDISWTGGGTNATRLSNWLDPTNTGAVTTNTTNVSLLTPAITGPDGICLPDSSAAYNINNLPICGTNAVIWSTNVPQVIVSPATGNTTTVIANGYTGLVTLTATVSGFVSIAATKLIYIGTLPSCSTRRAYWTLNGIQSNLFVCNKLTQVKCTNLIANIVSPCDYYANIWVDDPTATSITWSYVSSSGYTSWAANGNQAEVAVNYNSPDGWIILRCTTTNACGSYFSDYSFRPSISSNGCPVITHSCFAPFPGNFADPENKQIKIIPNPSNGFFTVNLISSEKTAAIKEIIIKNKMGITVYQRKFTNNQHSQTINLFNQPTDIYLIEVFDGKKWQTEKLSLLQ